MSVKRAQTYQECWYCPWITAISEERAVYVTDGLLDRARLTGEEITYWRFSVPTLGALCDVATAKALWAVYDWLGSGAPTVSAPLMVTLFELGTMLREAGIKRPKEVI